MCALLLLALLASAPSPERRSTETEPVNVESLLSEGIALRRDGKDHRALPLFQRAHDLASTSRTAAQLGLVEMQLGYWVRAERHLMEALSSPRDPWIFRNRPELESALQRTKAAIGELTVGGAPAGAEVMVNGVLVGRLPLAGPSRVGEGPVKVDVRAAGFEPDRRQFTIQGGERRSLQVVLAKLDAGSAASKVEGEISKPAQVTPSRPDAWLRPSAWLAATAAGVATGLGTWQLLAWREERDRFNDRRVPVVDAMGMSQLVRDCGAKENDHGGPQCDALYNDMNRARNRAILGYATGGVLAAGALTLFLLSRSGEGSGTGHSAANCTGGVSTTLLGGNCRLTF
jgi:hypothetical protein